MSPKVSDEYKEKKRIELLLAAKRVFERKGYEPATMADIIEEAGISRGTIYLYFSSVDEIFESLLDYLEQQGQFNIEEYINHFPSIWSAVQNFLTLQQQAIVHIDKGMIPVIFEYSVISWRDVDKREQLVLRNKKSKQIIFQLFEAGINSGEFTPARETITIIDFLLSYLNGITFETLNVGINEQKITEQMEFLQDILRRELGVV